jgi:starvation-inducible DNA-binding protein
MSNKPVTDALKKVLAESYGLMLKTQNYHWNVEGPNFPGLHALFMAQYSELFLAVDLVAERIRALGEKAPGSYGEFGKLSKITDGDGELDSDLMVKDLYESNVALLASIKKAFAAAEKAGDQPTIDLMNARSAQHEKTIWMLKSSLPKAIRAKL